VRNISATRRNFSFCGCRANSECHKGVAFLTYKSFSSNESIGDDRQAANLFISRRIFFPYGSSLLKYCGECETRGLYPGLHRTVFCNSYEHFRGAQPGIAPAVHGAPFSVFFHGPQSGGLFFRGARWTIFFFRGPHSCAIRATFYLRSVKDGNLAVAVSSCEQDRHSCEICISGWYIILRLALVS
jgi:hypothetical protein